MCEEVQRDISTLVKEKQQKEETLIHPSQDDVVDISTLRLKPAKTLRGIVSLVSISDTLPCGYAEHMNRCSSYTALSMMASSTSSLNGTVRGFSLGHVRKMLGTIFEVSDDMCIPIERLRFLKHEVLGRGAFGEVIRGELSMNMSTSDSSNNNNNNNSSSSAECISSISKNFPVFVSSSNCPMLSSDNAITFKENYNEIDYQHMTEKLSCDCGKKRRSSNNNSFNCLYFSCLFGNMKTLLPCRHEAHSTEGLTQPARFTPIGRSWLLLKEMFSYLKIISEHIYSGAINNSLQETLFSSSLSSFSTTTILNNEDILKTDSSWNMITPCHVDKVLTTRSVAIKRIDKIRLSRRKKFVTSFQTELYFAATLYHPFIVHVLGVAEDDAELYLLMDIAERGTLKEYMKTQESKILKQLAPRFFADIILGLEYLQNLGIAHRDIKPCNMLLTGDYHILLADFGSACYIHDDMTNTFGGTAAYMSPEMVEFGKASATSDLWAMGCVLFELFVGYVPFQGENRMFVMRKIKEYQNGSLEYPSDLPIEVKDLLCRLLQRFPNDRLGSDATGGFKALKAHPFFSGIDWRQIPKTSK